MYQSVEYQILFSHLPGTGAATYWKLLDVFPSLSAMFEAEDAVLRRLLSPETMATIREIRRDGEQSAAVRRMRADLRWTREHSVHVLDSDHEHYPELLRQTQRPPPLLYVKGDPGCLGFPQVAMVGSRSPTPTGLSTATDFAAELASHGFAVTSGLALGIDTAAHRGALRGGGRTLAVLGTGIDKIYPLRNRALADDILASGGAIVSEFPLGTPAQAGNFPRRNRIIAGLSYGTLVVEAAIKSGSLITTKYAIQENREVFAVPGSIHNPLSKGCHELIKNGAKLVETAQEIAEELQGFLSMQWENLQLDLDPNDHAIKDELVISDSESFLLEVLGYEPTSVDVLVERTGMPVNDVMATLLTMELRGLVANVGVGYMRLKPNANPLGLSFSPN